MPRIKFQTLAVSLGLPWPLRWQLSLAESLFFAPTFFMAVAFELRGDNFGKVGIPIQLPAFVGSIPNFQPKLFPMELYLLWIGLLTISQVKRWPLAHAFNRATLFTLGLIALGLARALPDLRANPLLVVRNAAFVWYLFLPLMIALYPLPSLKWESFFRFLYFVSFLYFALNLIYPIYTGDPKKVFWCIDMGLLLGLAYGLSTPASIFPRIALTALGFVLGLSYFGSIQRTTLIGLGLTFVLLAISPLFFSGSLPRPRWRRTAWIALGLALSVISVAGMRSYQQSGLGIVSAGVQAISSADPRRQSETNDQGLEKFRYYLWQDAWKEFRSAPLLGIGFLRPVVHRVYAWNGEFWDNTGSFEQRTRFDDSKTSPPLAGPHNSYLNALSRMGIFGIGFLLLHLMCGWLFLTRCYFACFFVLLWHMLYAFFNVSLEGPIRSFPLLILIGVALKLSVERYVLTDGPRLPAGFDLSKKLRLTRTRPDQPRRIGMVHVPYRLVGGEDQYVSALREAYRSLGIEPVNIPGEQPSSDLLTSAARSLTFGSPAEWDSIMESNSIEFLHLNNIHAALGPAFLRWIISRRIPTVMTVHNHRFYCTNGLALYGNEVCKACRPKASLLRPILRNCNGSLPKSIYHSAAMKEIRGDDLLRQAVTHFLAPSPYIARELQTSGVSPQKIRVFPHAVNVENAAARSPVPPSDVAFVGRLFPEKGVEHLLAAAKKLPHVSFAIVGEGPLESVMQKAAATSPNLHFHGKMARAEALAVMRESKVVCVPSVCHESFSLVAAEALSLGRRLVVPDTQSFLHYAEAPISAVTAVVTNPESLAYSLTMALEQPPRQAEEIKAIRERFNVSGFQSRLRQVVEELSS